MPGESEHEGHEGDNKEVTEKFLLATSFFWTFVTFVFAFPLQ